MSRTALIDLPPSPMSIARAETLKQQLSGKYVVVQEGVAELRRFQGLTGTVKTVNMNGRALVLFDGPVDIGWYDIDPAYLTVVDQPLPKVKKEVEKPAKAPAAAATPASKPAPAAGKSPLEMARAQGAAKADAPAGEKKLSPLEMARAQGASKAAGSAPSVPAGEKKLSPLEMARLQGAAKAAGNAPAAAPESVAAAPPAPPLPETVPAPVPVTPSASVAEKPKSVADILALARQQGAKK